MQFVLNCAERNAETKRVLFVPNVVVIVALRLIHLSAISNSVKSKIFKLRQ